MLGSRTFRLPCFNGATRLFFVGLVAMLACASSSRAQIIFQDPIVAGSSFESTGSWTLSNNISGDGTSSDSSTLYANPPSGRSTSGVVTDTSSSNNATEYVKSTAMGATSTSGYSTVFADFSLAVDNDSSTAGTNIANAQTTENSSLLAGFYLNAQAGNTWQLEVLTSTDASGSHAVTTATTVTGLPLDTWESFRIGETITSSVADANGHADVTWKLYTAAGAPGGAFNTTPIATGSGYSFSTFTVGTAQFINEFRMTAAGGGATEDLGIDDVTLYSSDPTPEPAAATVFIPATLLLLRRARRKAAAA